MGYLPIDINAHGRERAVMHSSDGIAPIIR